LSTVLVTQMTGE